MMRHKFCCGCWRSIARSALRPCTLCAEVLSGTFGSVSFADRSVLVHGLRDLRAGQDFALMGFDNVLDAAHANPPLSTVDIRPGALGAQAATLLLARIAEPARARQTYYAEPRLLLRQSA